jgi:transposase
LYRIHLLQAQRLELKRRARSRTTAPRTRDRLEMVRLSDGGLSVPQIARLVGISEVQVRYWVKRLLEGGFDALPDAPYLGQESALSPKILESVRAQLRQGGRTWTAQQIADWIAEEHGVRRSGDRVGRMLRRAGVSYKRTHRRLTHKQKSEAMAAKKCMAALGCVTLRFYSRCEDNFTNPRSRRGGWLLPTVLQWFARLLRERRAPRDRRGRGA